jgi:hypothetical protein
MTTTRICDTCGNNEAWHTETNPRHTFNDGSLSTLDTFGKKDGPRAPIAPVEAVIEAQWPWDPVLRQALIDKGLLTPRDLSEAERKIRAVTGQFLNQEAPHVPSTE